MKSKVMIAGAIVALAALCVLAAATYSIASQGQAPACSVNGYVIDNTGKGLSGLDVTLHVLSYDNSTETSKELYTMAAKTGDTPKAGTFTFDQVKIPEGTVFAYAETSINVNGTTFTGRSNNYSLISNGNITTGIVLMTQATPVRVYYEDSPKYALIGNVTDADGNPLGGVNVTVHVIGVRASTGDVHEVYTRTLKSHDDLPLVGTFTDSFIVPVGMEHVDAYIVKYLYADAYVLDNGMMLYGRSDNFTLKANDTVNVGVVIHMPP